MVIADVRARALRIDVQDGHVLNRGSKDARSFSGKLQCPGGRKTRTGGTGNSSPGPVACETRGTGLWGV